jgi:hypothetical protein
MQTIPEVEDYMEPIQRITHTLDRNKPVSHDVVTAIYNAAYTQIDKALRGAKP